MASYKGEVISNQDDALPFLAVITDEDGTVVSEAPVRSVADGEAVIAETIRELQDEARELEVAADANEDGEA